MMGYSRQAWSWAVYDWANSSFATVVMAGFFPVFFREYWNAGVDSATSTLRLGIANSVASLLIVLLAPLLGAAADNLGRRKGMLLAFAFLGLLTTGGLFLVGRGDWQIAVFCYVVALIGFSGSNIFYDSLLPFVAGETGVDRLSALGFSLGYLGGGLLLLLNVMMSTHPDWFGLVDGSLAVRWSFLMVSLWWLVFSLPLVLFVPEPGNLETPRRSGVIRESLCRVWQTLHEVKRIRNVWLFLLAYWLYIDGVDTVIRMAVDYGMSLGFDYRDLIMALLITQFTGFPCALFFGWLGDHIGARAGIFTGLAVYIVVTVWASLMDSAREFYALALLIGFAQGGVQALSRSFYARMIPLQRSAEFFGFYNMLGKFAAVLGPLMVGVAGFATGNARLGILTLLMLFAGGAFLLSRCDLPPRPTAVASDR